MLAQELALASMALAAADGAGAGSVDVSRLHGLSLWLACLHNDHRLLYAAVAVAMLWAAGMLLGVATEFVLALLGRETERLDLTE